MDSLEKLYGCQLVWKIEQWADKVHEAKLGRKSTLFSPPFLTSRHGYKMAMSLCPYGDGKGRRNHVDLRCLNKEIRQFHYRNVNSCKSLTVLY